MLCVLLLGVWGASLERVLGPTLKALAPKLQLLRLEPEALRSALLALPADEDDALILAASLRSKAAEHTLDALVDAVSVNPSGSYPDATLVSAFLGAIEPTYEGQYEEQQLVRAAASSLLRVDALLQRFADGLSPPTRARASAALSLSATEQQRVDDLPVLLSAALAPSVDEIRKKQPLWTEEQLEIVALDAIATELLDFGEGADWDEDELDDQHGAGWRGGGAVPSGKSMSLATTLSFSSRTIFSMSSPTLMAAQLRAAQLRLNLPKPPRGPLSPLMSRLPQPSSAGRRRAGTKARTRERARAAGCFSPQRSALRPSC